MNYYNVKIDLLSEENYKTWHLQMKAILIKKNLWNCIEEPKPYIDEKERQNIYNEQQAFAELVLSINTPELKRIEDCKSAKDIWLKIQETNVNQIKTEKLSPISKPKEIVAQSLQQQVDSDDGLEVLRSKKFIASVNNLQSFGTKLENEMEAMQPSGTPLDNQACNPIITSSRSSPPKTTTSRLTNESASNGCPMYNPNDPRSRSSSPKPTTSRSINKPAYNSCPLCNRNVPRSRSSSPRPSTSKLTNKPAPCGNPLHNLNVVIARLSTLKPIRLASLTKKPASYGNPICNSNLSRSRSPSPMPSTSKLTNEPASCGNPIFNSNLARSRSSTPKSSTSRLINEPALSRSRSPSPITSSSGLTNEPPSNCNPIQISNLQVSYTNPVHTPNTSSSESTSQSPILVHGLPQSSSAVPSKFNFGAIKRPITSNKSSVRNHKRYKSKTTVNVTKTKVTLLKNLIKMKLTDYSYGYSYAEHFLSTVNRLKTIGMELDQDLKAVLLVQGIPEDFGLYQALMFEECKNFPQTDDLLQVLRNSQFTEMQERDRRYWRETLKTQFGLNL